MNFTKVYNINVSANVEKKGKFKYLSWAYAWKWFVEQYPDASYEIVKGENNKCHFGDEKTGYMVYTKVTVEKLTHEMWLPVMDHNNKAIKVPGMMDINKAVMRCLVKNLAMFGLGLNIYAGEDLPEEPDNKEKEVQLKAERLKLEAKQKVEAERKKNYKPVHTSDELVAIAELKGFDNKYLLDKYKKDTTYDVTDVTYINGKYIDAYYKKLETLQDKA